ncbi:MaoC family dehydratase [Brevundimonas diminuta]|uniref:MaoC family dehydratase n=1 Tax=Brevundimonas diminuta TaxID=293 RepID=UPI003209747E
MVVFENPRDMLDQQDLPLGASEWLSIDQDRIDGFARVTGDDQWIHVDPERARNGPFGATIAHGYLTVSLANLFLPQILEVRGFSMGVNVGVDTIRFLAPVRVGSRLRGSGVLLYAQEAKGESVQAVVRLTVEIDGEAKPACVLDAISRYYP